MNATKTLVRAVARSCSSPRPLLTIGALCAALQLTLPVPVDAAGDASDLGPAFATFFSSSSSGPTQVLPLDPNDAGARFEFEAVGEDEDGPPSLGGCVRFFTPCPEDEVCEPTGQRICAGTGEPCTSTCAEGSMHHHRGRLLEHPAATGHRRRRARRARSMRPALELRHESPSRRPCRRRRSSSTTCGGNAGESIFCRQDTPHPVFGASSLLDVKKPVRFCVPVEKRSVEDEATSCPVEPTGAVRQPDAGLVCYATKPAKKDRAVDGGKISQAKHGARAVFAHSWLAAHALATKKDVELCLPSTLREASAP